MVNPLTKVSSYHDRLTTEEFNAIRIRFLSLYFYLTKYVEYLILFSVDHPLISHILYLRRFKIPYFYLYMKYVLLTYEIY